MVTTTVVSQDGEGGRLAPGGAAERARALERVLPAVRRRPPLVRGIRGRACPGVRDLRRQDAASLPCLRGAVLVDLRDRVRGVRRRPPRARAPRHAHPAAGALALWARSSTTGTWST